MIVNLVIFFFLTAINEGGECNTTMATFQTDITEPVEGRLRAGPFFDLVSSFLNVLNGCLMFTNLKLKL